MHSPDMHSICDVIMHALLTLGAHARSEGYYSCPVCVYVCVFVCLFVVFCHHAHLDPKYRYVRFNRDTENTYMIVIFAKNAWFRSYGVICLPRMPPTTLNAKRRMPKELAEGWKAIDSRDFN